MVRRRYGARGAVPRFCRRLNGMRVVEVGADSGRGNLRAAKTPPPQAALRGGCCEGLPPLTGKSVSIRQFPFSMTVATRRAAS